jgi:hypothetical protein
LCFLSAKDDFLLINYNSRLKEDFHSKKEHQDEKVGNFSAPSGA